MAAQRVILLIPVLIFLTQLYIIEVRAVDGNWGAWLEWDPCSASCGEGERRRMRFCNNPPPRDGGAYCAGRAIQYQECEAPIGCPVDGEWSEWSAWTPGSVTCGAGIKSRQRYCDSPPPANGGRNCAGSSEQRTKYASEEDCPRNGGWSNWSKWSPCSVTCGRGFSFRYRECENPPPSDNGKDCAGRTQETRECTAKRECADTPVCASPPDIEGAITSHLNHPVGTTVTYTCPYGFESRNSSNNVSVCTFNPITGRPEWTGPEIICIETNILCPPIDTSGDFTLQYSNNRRINSTVTFYCKDGSKRMEGSSSLNCLSNGTWSGQNPKCVEVTCEEPQPPKHGNVKLHGDLKVGSLATYSCDPGRKLNGNPSTECLISGQWNFEAPECLIITCDPPKSIENGHAIALSSEYGSELEYKCDKGFNLNTDETIYCTEGGIWSKTDVACIVITCDPPKNIENGHAIAKSFEYGSELEYKCDKGFNLNTDETIYCTEDGIWSKTDVACIAPCRSTPPFAANAEVVEVNRIHGGTVSYECLPDYKKRTEETVTCVKGEWMGEPPSCESTKCSVNTLTSPGLQKGHKLFYRDGEVFAVTCNQNYRLDTENSGRIMCKEGTWTGDLSPCVPECGTNRFGRETDIPLVTGVTNANEGTWPWMVAIQWKENTDSFMPWITGFLIDKNHVLSAAHGFTHKEEPHMYRVVLGSVNEEAGEVYTVTRIVVPRGYTEGSYNDNIAILTLSRDVDIPDFVPVCLPDNRIINMKLTGSGTIVAGWGTAWYRKNDRFLKQLPGVHVLSDEECKTEMRWYQSKFPRGTSLESGMFCAGFEKDIGNRCWLQEGGPLMLLDRNRWFAVGIISIHPHCTDSKVPAAFTRVASYLEWIRENTRD